MPERPKISEIIADGVNSIQIKLREKELADLLIRMFAAGQGNAEQAYLYVQANKKDLPFSLSDKSAKRLLKNKYIREKLVTGMHHVHAKKVERLDQDKVNLQIEGALIRIFSNYSSDPSEL